MKQNRHKLPRLNQNLKAIVRHRSSQKNSIQQNVRPIVAMARMLSLTQVKNCRFLKKGQIETPTHITADAMDGINW